MVENRFVGMKSRGVYEAPGMTILYTAHRLVEQLTMDRDLMHLRDRLAPEVAEMVYYGFWYHAKLDALMAFIRQAQEPVTGEVALNLYKGNIDVAGRSSPNNLYDEGIATMEGGGSYNQTDAEGFLRIQGLPGRVQGRMRARKYLEPPPHGLDLARNFAIAKRRDELGFIGIQAVAEELDGPIVFHGTDREDRRPVLVGFPHFDCRAHGGLGNEGQEHVDLAAHEVVAKEHFPAG